MGTLSRARNSSSPTWIEQHGTEPAVALNDPVDGVALRLEHVVEPVSRLAASRTCFWTGSSLLGKSVRSVRCLPGAARPVEKVRHVRAPWPRAAGPDHQLVVDHVLAGIGTGLRRRRDQPREVI